MCLLAVANGMEMPGAADRAPWWRPARLRRRHAIHAVRSARRRPRVAVLALRPRRRRVDACGGRTCGPSRNAGVAAGVSASLSARIRRARCEPRRRCGCLAFGCLSLSFSRSGGVASGWQGCRAEADRWVQDSVSCCRASTSWCPSCIQDEPPPCAAAERLHGLPAPGRRCLSWLHLQGPACGLRAPL